MCHAIRRPARALAVVVSLVTTTAYADTWRWSPSIAVEETLTNNVNLTSARQSDLVSQLTPALAFSGTGAHASVNGSIALPILLYVRTAAENNTVQPQANVTGNAELIERFLYIDGAISVSQQFFTPFGAQPDNLANATNNRYTSQIYRVSPYIKGEATERINYELRVDNIWSNLSDTPTSFDGIPVNTSNSYTNQITGKILREPLPLGWQIDYVRSDVRFSDQADSQIQSLGRLRILYQVDSELQLGASIGYERNDFPLTSYSGSIYGVGYKWRPSPTLSSEGFWEHRYFGGSYAFTLDYRTPLSVWSVNASRLTTSYPQQLATLPAGGDVASLLNSVLTSRVADPLQRQQIVDQMIRDRGLPATLPGPVPLYTQQITLQTVGNVTFGILGARNSIFFSGGYLKSEPISGSGDPLPPVLSGGNDNTQYTTGISLNHQLTQAVNIGVSFTWSQTVPNAPILLPGETAGLSATTNTAVRAFIGMPLSANTSVYGGARYQTQTSKLSQNAFSEAAAFVGIRHTFR